MNQTVFTVHEQCSLRALLPLSTESRSRAGSSGLNRERGNTQVGFKSKYTHCSSAPATGRKSQGPGSATPKKHKKRVRAATQPG